MRRPTTALAVLTLVAALLAACGEEDPGVTVDPDEETGEEVDGAFDGAEDAGGSDDRTADGEAGGLQGATDAAIADLAATEDADASAIEVVVSEEVTWSDSSLGCPEPDVMYTQALVPGYRVVLALDGDEVHYHGAEGHTPQRCADPQPPADA